MDESKPNAAFFKKLCTLTFFYGQLLCWLTLVFTIWALLNSDKDNVVELSFFIFIFIFTLFNTYIAIFKMGPIIFFSPKNLSSDEYGKLLEKVINISKSLIMGFFQPMLVGCMGIIAQELENNPNQLLMALGAAILFFIGFVLLFYRATWSKSEFLKVTGQAYIGF